MPFQFRTRTQIGGTPRRTRARVCLLAAAVALSLSACDEATSPAARPAARAPALQITDAVHNAGTAHFYLLPPLVAQPVTAGEFDGEQHPTVEICELVESGCGPVIAHFSRKGGTGEEAIKVDPANGRYFVNWNTQRCRTGACTLDPAKFYRIRFLLAGLELGHADLDVVSRPQDIRSATTGEFIPLVDGKLLQIRFRLEHGIKLVNHAQQAANAARFHPNSVRYGDRGTKPATGRSGSATLAARALLNKDGTTDIEVTTGTLDAATAPPGNLAHVQLKALKEDGDALWTQNYTGLTAGGGWQASSPILGRGVGFQVQANVTGIDANRTDVVTVRGTVGRRPDLVVENLSHPGEAQLDARVIISATVRESNGDVGAAGDCNLYVDGAKVDQALGIWVDAGDVVSCAFSYTFTTSGTKALAVRMEGVVPGDDDLTNNGATGTIAVVGRRGGFSYYASAHEHDHEDVFAYASKYEVTSSDDPTYRYYYEYTLKNGHYSVHEQGQYMTGFMSSEVTFPLTRAQLAVASGGTTRHAVTFDDLAADYTRSYSSGSFSQRYSCVTRLRTDPGFDGIFVLCTGSYRYDGAAPQSWTSFYFYRYAGVATYYSENTHRLIFTPENRDEAYVWTYSFSWEAGTPPLVALGADYAFTVVLKDTPIGGSTTTYSMNPVIALDQRYDNSWNDPYRCDVGGYTSNPFIVTYEGCSSRKGYQRYYVGQASGVGTVSP